MDIQVGQNIFITEKYGKGSIQEHVVTKVGNKYFYVGNRRFFRDTMIEDVKYGSQKVVFLSQEDYDNEMLRRSLVHYFHNLNWFNFTLESLKKIKEITDAENK